MTVFDFNNSFSLRVLIPAINEVASSLVNVDLPSRRLKASVAESITSGKIQSAFGSVSGASASFAGGSTAYSINSKAKLFGIDYHHAEKCNCVSERVAREMSKGVITLFGASFGIASTGYAEPSSEHKIAFPHAFVGISAHNKGQLITKSISVTSSCLDYLVDEYNNDVTIPYHFISKREAFQYMVTYAALFESKRFLSELN